jgi:hypothetical protein
MLSSWELDAPAAVLIPLLYEKISSVAQRAAADRIPLGASLRDFLVWD